MSGAVLRVLGDISSLNTVKVFDECLLKAKYVFLWSDSELLVWLEKAIATHSSTLAWRIPWTEEPVQSMGSQRVRHD